MGRFLKTCGYVYQPSSTSHILFDAAAVLFSSKRALQGREYGGPSAERSGRKDGEESKRNVGYGFTTFNFVRPIHSGFPLTHGSHVQLIGVTCDPIEFIVNNFHSSTYTQMSLPYAR